MQTNRSFLYGESVFTTALVCQGRILFFSEHLQRLLQGANFLWGPLLQTDLDIIKEKILKEISPNLTKEGLRITLSFEDSERQILRPTFNPQGIRVDCLSFDRGEQIGPAKLRTLKTCDEQKFLPDYLKTSRKVQETLIYFKSGYLQEQETLLFCSPEEDVFEASWANIFAVKGNTLFTPPTGGSVLAGIMRSKILEKAHHYFTEVRVENLNLSWLKTCDFVFLSNSLWGVIPVKRIDSTNFNLPVNDFFKFEKDILDEETRG